MKHLLIGLVRLYRLLLSPWVGGQCRFYPTCSAYTIGALERHGAAAGSYLGAVRILRCHPWCQGGHEPVPEHFTWAPWRRDATSSPDPADAECGALVQESDAVTSAPMHNSASLPGESGVAGGAMSAAPAAKPQSLTPFS